MNVQVISSANVQGGDDPDDSSAALLPEVVKGTVREKIQHYETMNSTNSQLLAESEGPPIHSDVTDSRRGRNRVKTDPPRLELSGARPLANSSSSHVDELCNLLSRRPSLDPLLRDKIKSSKTFSAELPDVLPPTPPRVPVSLKRRKSVSHSVETIDQQEEEANSYLLRRSSVESTTSSFSKISDSESEESTELEREHRATDPGGTSSPDSRSSSRRKSFPGRRKSIDVNAKELANWRLHLYVTQNVGSPSKNIRKIIDTYEKLVKLKPGIATLDQVQHEFPAVSLDTWEEGEWAVKARLREIKQDKSRRDSGGSATATTTVQGSETNHEYIGDPSPEKSLPSLSDESSRESAGTPGTPDTTEMLMRALELVKKEKEELKRENEELKRRESEREAGGGVTPT
ncbi:hypothetical protein TrST_g6096 [Triparma strigata]|uniref:Uncharacterized protein n=1 Tax=Triparma strigata TaxID=1606541 RepID=A0A9W7F3M5_9STRA|nr:hypothetical protein TrST_g6096 [Triparma strigata]